MSRLVGAAVVLTLVGLGVSLVHLLWSTPLTFTLFMLVGQGALGAGMLLYGVSIFRDLRARKVL